MKRAFVIAGRQLPYECEWFAACGHPAAGTVEHPILGPVPVCERCAGNHNLDLKRWEVTS